MTSHFNLVKVKMPYSSLKGPREKPLLNFSHSSYKSFHLLDTQFSFLFLKQIEYFLTLEPLHSLFSLLDTPFFKDSPHMDCAILPVWYAIISFIVMICHHSIYLIFFTVYLSPMKYKLYEARDLIYISRAQNSLAHSSLINNYLVIE